MADQFEEAPPLPRGFTNIEVPNPPSDPLQAASISDDHTAAVLPPPPKFPSLTNVTLPYAQTAAGANPTDETAPPSVETPQQFESMPISAATTDDPSTDPASEPGATPSTVIPEPTTTSTIASTTPQPPPHPELSVTGTEAAIETATDPELPVSPVPQHSETAATATTASTFPESASFSTSTTTTATAATSTTEQTLKTARAHPIDESTGDNLDHDALHEDIMAAIERDAVTPGTGARRAVEIGRELWTSKDQEELDRLLAEGQDVYVPPDVGVADLPVARASGYAYVPVPPPDGGVDTSPDKRSMADRIAIWNQVVPTESLPTPNQAAYLGRTTSANSTTNTSDRKYAAGGFAAGSAAAATTSASLAASATDGGTLDDNTTDYSLSRSVQTNPSFNRTDDLNDDGDDSMEVTTAMRAADRNAAEIGATNAPYTPVRAIRAEETPNKYAMTPKTPTSTTVPTNADVRDSIFGAMFDTVPIKSPDYTKDDQMSGADAVSEAQPATMQDVLLKANTASIKVMKDYGLKGGHNSIVNDADFMHGDDTLITCGDDGRVCIWDMTNQRLQGEFEPYGGESVRMVKALPDDGEPHSTIMTLSKSRVMRIWWVDESQAVMLRSNNIKDSEHALYMSVPIISKELKARAISAAAAAALKTSDMNPEEVTAATTTTSSAAAATATPNAAGTSEPAEVGSPAGASTQPTSPAPSAMTPPPASATASPIERVRNSLPGEEAEEDRDRRKFSLSKVFGGRSQRRAVAS